MLFRRTSPQSGASAAQRATDRWSFMKSEKWYWLFGFSSVSLIFHLGLVLNSREFRPPMAMAQTKEIEVALQPLPQEPPKPEVKPKPQPPPKPMMRQTPEPKP